MENTSIGVESGEGERTPSTNTLGQYPEGAGIDVDEVHEVVNDKEHHKWIKEQYCYLCDPRFTPRGPSDPHHVGDGIHSRRSLILRVPLCRRHHELMKSDGWLEKLLRLRDVALWYLKIHIWEKENLCERKTSKEIAQEIYQRTGRPDGGQTLQDDHGAEDNADGQQPRE